MKKENIITILLVLIFVSIIVFGFALLNKNKSKVYTKDICNGPLPYTKTEGFFDVPDEERCFNDCAELCKNLGYKYKSSYAQGGDCRSSPYNGKTLGCSCDCYIN